MGMGDSKGGNIFLQRWFEGSCAACLHIDMEPQLLQPLQPQSQLLKSAAGCAEH
tara:strand:- start:192 stop:353 length:162 start_codon:yes stop_codon:yes gene_type:complete